MLRDCSHLVRESYFYRNRQNDYPLWLTVPRETRTDRVLKYGVLWLLFFGSAMGLIKLMIHWFGW